jgi:hypothetical protein
VAKAKRGVVAGGKNAEVLAYVVNAALVADVAPNATADTIVQANVI